MGLIAGGVALAGVAASAASSAMKDRGTSLNQGAAFTPRSLRENMMDREVEGINRIQTDLMSNAMGQWSNLAPELYASALGMVPQFEDQSDRVGPLSQELDALRAEQADLQNQKARRGKKGKKKIKKKLRRSKKRTQTLEEEFLRVQSMPKRITGFTKANPDDLPADSPLSSKNRKNQISALTNDSLIRALRGEEPLDQSMVNRWRDTERQVRSQLRRNLGPDFETSSAGIEAMAQFEEDKDEAFQNFNRDTILSFSALSNANATVREQQLSGILDRGAFMPNTQMGLARNLAVPVAGFEAALGRNQNERGLSAPQPMRNDPGAASELLGQVGQGLGGAGGTGLEGALTKGVEWVKGKFGGVQDPNEGFTGFTSSDNQTMALETPTGQIIR